MPTRREKERKEAREGGNGINCSLKLVLKNRLESKNKNHVTQKSVFKDLVVRKPKTGFKCPSIFFKRLRSDA